MADKGVASREVRLAMRPHGKAEPCHFSLGDVTVGPPDDGDVVVRNSFMSVDPSMRKRMDEARLYTEPFRVGETLWGPAIGTVIESRSGQFSPGDTAVHSLGWREVASGPAELFRRVTPRDGASPADFLNAKGWPGLTAYIGLTETASHRASDSVFVSAAAGAVGSLVGQLALARGSTTVVGSAGSDEKVRFLRDALGFTAAFNHRTTPVSEGLSSGAPDGIDIYFDNVGGDSLEAAIDHLREFGRVAMCGAIAGYQSSEPAPGPRNLFEVINKRLRLEGLIISDHVGRREEVENVMDVFLADGNVNAYTTIRDGIENAVAAFLGLLDGDNVGKMLVRLDPTAPLPS